MLLIFHLIGFHDIYIFLEVASYSLVPAMMTSNTVKRMLSSTLEQHQDLKMKTINYISTIYTFISIIVIV
jgi:hypothetical protein